MAGRRHRKRGYVAQKAIYSLEETYNVQVSSYQRPKRCPRQNQQQ